MIQLKKPDEPKLILDHKNYGAWYINPNKWEERFQSLSDPKAMEIVKSRSLLRAEKRLKYAGVKEDILAKHVSMFYNI